MTNPSSEYVNERYALEAEERRRREMLERRAKQTPAERWQEVKENMGGLAFLAVLGARRISDL